MNLTPNNIHDILSLLGESLSHKKVEPSKLIVCGGSALNVLNLVTRTTKDIDVIGGLDHNQQWIRELPPELWVCVKDVGAYYSLPEDWFNLGPQSYLDTGLPEGLVERLTWKSYGPILHIGFISRIDQVYFKLYASADRAGYHVDDLLHLKPSGDEIMSASKWCLSQDISDGFREILISMLKQLGFSSEAERL
jgi:hypothetical protein